MTAPPPIDAVQIDALPMQAMIDNARVAGRDPGLHALHKDADLKSVSVTLR